MVNVDDDRRDSLRRALETCLSNDNAERKRAEAYVEQTIKSHPGTLTELAANMCQHAQDEVRHIAALILRGKVEGFWAKLALDPQAQIQAALLERILQEPTPAVRRAVVHVAAAVARLAYPANTWPSLLPFMKQCTESEMPAHREAAMVLFKALTEALPGVLTSHFVELHGVFVRGLQDSDPHVRFASLQAVAGLQRLVAESDEHARLFQQLMPQVLAIMEQLRVDGEEERLEKAVGVLLDVIDCPRPLLGPYVQQTADLSMRCACCKELSLDSRFYCLQILHWLAMCKPKQLAKMGGVPTITRALCDLAAEAPAETAADDAADESASTAARTFSMQCLDDLALNLPTKQVLQPVLEFASAARTSPEAGVRGTGLLALAMVMEGCAHAVKKLNLGSLVSEVLRALGDPDGFVRGEAAYCMSRMAANLHPDFVEHVPAILPALLHQLASEKDARALERAVFALDNCMDGVAEDVLQPHLPAIVPLLTRLLSECDRSMHDTLFSCISSAASAGGEAFQEFAEPILPTLERYLTLIRPEDMTARTTATECVGLVVACLSTTRAAEVLPPFLQATISGFSLECPSLNEYAHGLLGTASRLLREAFHPWLEAAVQLAFQSLEADDGKVLNRGEEDDEESDDDGDAIDGPAIGEERTVVVRSGATDEKAAALCALGQYAFHMGAAFAPYVQRTLEFCMQLAEHLHYDPRQQAIEAAARVVLAVHAATPPQAPAGGVSTDTCAALEATLDLVLRTIEQDDQSSVVVGCITALGELCEFLPAGTLSKAVAAKVVDALAGIVVEPPTVTCRQHTSPAEDGDELEELLAEQDELLACTVDLLPKLAAMLGPDVFVEAWQAKLGVLVVQRLSQGNTDVVRSATVGCVAELFAVAGLRMAAYLPDLLPFVLQEVKNRVAENRHHAAFALGHMAAACGPSMDKVTLDGIQSVLLPLLHDTSRAVVENAAGAVARIAVAHVDRVVLAQLLPPLMSVLPIQLDFEEAPPVYDGLAELLIGPKRNELVELRVPFVKLAGMVVMQQKVPSGSRVKCAEALKALHTIGGAEVAAAAAALPMEQQAAIQGLVACS